RRVLPVREEDEEARSPPSNAPTWRPASERRMSSRMARIGGRASGGRTVPGRSAPGRALPGLALSSSDAARHGSFAEPGAAMARDEARMLSNWESRCARTLPFRSGRLADEPARILGPVARGRSD